MKELKFGRWRITDDSIETIKENQEVRSIHKTELWDWKKENSNHYFIHPVEMCQYGWLSNTDILDLNSAFIAALEIFSDMKPENNIEISWVLTLTKQYERINRSVDVNSYDGRVKWEQKKKFNAEASFEEIAEASRIELNKDSDLLIWRSFQCRIIYKRA